MTICKPMLAALLLLGSAMPAPALAQGDAPGIEQRLQRMEDESAIRRLLIEYGAALDGRDFASYAGLFTEDGVWVGGFGSFTGRAAIRDMLEDALGTPEPGFVNMSNFHMLTNPLITLEGDSARVTSKFMFWTRSSEDRPTPLMAGRYEDDFVRVDGQWRIARRVTHGEVPFDNPGDPSMLAGPPPAPAAGSVEARLQRAEDELAIRRILIEYAARIDARDFDGYADLFAREGVWQNGDTVRRGRAEIRDLLVGLFGEPDDAFVNTESYHLVSSPQVDVDGDRATARSRHLLIMRGEGGAPVPELTGVYEDEYIREDGTWKILRRVDNPIMPNREEWMAEITARTAASVAATQ